MMMTDRNIYPQGDVETWIRNTGERVLDINRFKRVDPKVAKRARRKAEALAEKLWKIWKEHNPKEMGRNPGVEGLIAAGYLDPGALGPPSGVSDAFLNQFWANHDELIHIFEDRLQGNEELNYHAAMMIDPNMVKPDERIDGVRRLRDCLSGMKFCLEEPLRIDMVGLTAQEKAVWITAAQRYKLLLRLKRPVPSLDAVKKVTEAFAIVRPGNPSILATPIVNFDVTTRDECERALESIRASIQEVPAFRRLWLRGQRQEYFIERSQDTWNWLGFGGVGTSTPSLVPSLGRVARVDPSKVDLGFAFDGPQNDWKKPFIVWVLRQNKKWMQQDNDFFRRFEDCLVNPSFEDFAIASSQLGPYAAAPAELSELFSWFLNEAKYSAWTWVLQQYGYLASMLDVTDDLDIALFFAEAEMIDNRIRLVEPCDERVIYVFAEFSDIPVFWDSDRIRWGEGGWSDEPPPRMRAQRAACLVGSTWFRQNLYGHLILARIRLSGKACRTRMAAADLFPPPEDDLLLKTLTESKPRPPGLYW